MNLIEPSRFEKKINNRKVHLFTLKNNDGTVVQITNYGARVVSLYTCDKKGDFGDIVLGYDCIEDYLETDNMYFGATIGRYGNRIANASFTINENTYCLDANEDINMLHGGRLGFHACVWEAQQVANNKLSLTYFSKDGDQGFPGNLKVTVTYTVSEDNELIIDYHSTTDKTTVVNLTHHSYFNLKDGGRSTINKHLLKINAASFLPINDSFLPIGNKTSVKDTPFDFNTSIPIGARILNKDPQLILASGYDHNYVLNGQDLRQVAEVVEPNSGRIMEVITNKPGMQFYSGNHVSDAITGKYGISYGYRHGFCLETQYFPDSPNQSNFPTAILRPDEVYTSTTIYKFSTLK